MKIYILPVDPRLQPDRQPFRYPSHNRATYGVAPEFLWYLKNRPEFLTDDPRSADWHYLPVFWTRWILHHDFGQCGTGMLALLANTAIIDDSKTFTICQSSIGPTVSLGRTRVFLTSRSTDDGEDIPLLCDDHPIPELLPAKRWRASFVGMMGRHAIRQVMSDRLDGRDDILIVDDNLGEDFFVDCILSSYISLCPRGFGGGSFRFFESMQLGTVPLFYGDIDTRPFKQFIDWDSMSFFTDCIGELMHIIDHADKQVLLDMGLRAKRFYYDNLRYGLWCQYVIRTLQGGPQ